MLLLFKSKKIKKCTEDARAYIASHYVETTPQNSTGVKFSSRGCFSRSESSEVSTPQVQYQMRDAYNENHVASLVRSAMTEAEAVTVNSVLEQNVNMTFVEKVISIINEKGLKDSQVYRAAQIDRRLFSKMTSDRQYKPAKDTAIATALALELSIEQAKDLLSRAGYTFSHSNKRDIVIEFFFREKIYSLVEANLVLDRLGQKTIGR